MKTAYYVHFYNGFANAYNLYHAPESVSVPAEWKRITRAEAIDLCRREIERRKEAPMFSGYASSMVLPYNLVTADMFHLYGWTAENLVRPRKLTIRDHIVRWEEE